LIIRHDKELQHIALIATVDGIDAKVPALGTDQGGLNDSR